MIGRRRRRSHQAEGGDTPPPPDSLAAVLARIDERLTELGFSDRHASMLAGRSPGFIRSIRKQHRTGAQKSITRPMLLLLAQTIQTNPVWLATGQGPKHADSVAPAPQLPPDISTHADLIEREGEPRVSFEKMTRPLRRGRHSTNGSTVRRGMYLKVTEKIAAGAWFEGSAEGPLMPIDIPADPRYPAEQQIAVAVDDNSVNHIASPGDFLVVDTKRSPNANDIALVSRNKSNLREVTARRYLPDGDSVELRCESNDKRYQGSLTVKDNMRASDGSTVKIEGVVIYVYRPLS